MEIIQRLRASAAIVLTHLELHGRLASMEWQQEKNRLQQLLVFSMLGLMCVFCFLIFVGVLVIALGWPTEYRLYTVAGVVVFYATGLAICCFRCKRLLAQGATSFAETRAEVAADIELIRSQL